MLRAPWFVFRVAGGVWLTNRCERKHNVACSRGKMVLDIRSLIETHNRSSRSVAYLEGARLERSIDN